jgi:hypothetical protein
MRLPEQTWNTPIKLNTRTPHAYTNTCLVPSEEKTRAAGLSQINSVDASRIYLSTDNDDGRLVPIFIRHTMLGIVGIQFI